ncbi:hypothetical protein G6F22_021683 [Rhizopus arrhizus]|nr:hypothetical protein G6F22_021683 [Rhizopus arrhizus]
MRGVFGDVSCRAAVFAAQRQALQQAQHDQDGRCGQTDAGIAGQHAHEECRQAHDHDRDQEGVFASDQITQAAEHQRAERPHGKASGERQQREDEARSGR